MVTERQKEILTCVVNNFIDTAQPMSSKMVLDALRINLSSATIRQIFAKLDHLGYLAKLHTSSGRIPTSKGYRLVVDDMDVERPTAISLGDYIGKTSVVQKFQQLFDVMLDNVSTRLPYIPVLMYHSHVISDIECIRYVPINSMIGLLLVYHKVGIVSEYYVNFKKQLSVQDTDELIRWILISLKKEPKIDLIQAKRIFSGDDYLFVESVSNALSMNGYSIDKEYQFLYRNSYRCIQLPDFSDKSSIESLLDALDQNDSIVRLLKSTIDQGQLSVFIGSEIGDDRLSECSLIGIPIALDGMYMASLGILGPIRMDYQSVIDMLTSGESLAELIQV